MNGVKILALLSCCVLLSHCGEWNKNNPFKPVQQPNTPSPGGGSQDGVVPCGGGNSATVKWIPSTTRKNGDPLTNPYGYTISWGLASRDDVGTYSNEITVINNTIDNYVVEDLPRGEEVFFAVQIFDTTWPSGPDSTSDYSNELSRVIPLAVCPPGQKPMPEPPPEEPPYQKPSWCSNKVDLKFHWAKVDKATQYIVSAGPYRNRITDDFVLRGGRTSIDFEARRGEKVFIKALAKRQRSTPVTTRQFVYQALTCQELEENINNDPNYKEKREIELKWSGRN